MRPDPVGGRLSAVVGTAVEPRFENLFRKRRARVTGIVDEKWLDRFRLFDRVAPDLRREILDASTQATLHAGSIAFLSGEACHRVPLVIEGRLTVVLGGASGRELPIDRVEAGSPCPISLNCALCQLPYPADCRVPVQAFVAWLPARAFRSAVDRDANLRQAALVVTSRYGWRLTELLEEIAFSTMDQRMARALLRRLERASRPGVVETTHERLAAELGSSREVVSRILKSLEREGALELKWGRIRVRDRRALRELGRSASGDWGATPDRSQSVIAPGPGDPPDGSTPSTPSP